MEKHREKVMDSFALFNGKDLDVVTNIVRDEVQWVFGDWDRDQGIGSSDINASVRNVLREIWGGDFHLAEILDVEVQMIRNAVNNEINKVLV